MLARELLGAVGPGRFLLVGVENGALTAELMRQGCDIEAQCPGSARFTLPRPDRGADDRHANASFDTVVLNLSVLTAVVEPILVFDELRELRSRFVVLTSGLDAGQSIDRDTLMYWRRAALRGGFRRSLYATDPQRDEACGANAPALTVFERIGNEALACPVTVFDATRDDSPRSDARLMRYHLASRWVRPNDCVLDWNCGAGDGAAVLAARTAAARVVASDRNSDHIAYAQAHFGTRGGIDSHVAQGDGPEFLPDASVDLVVAFEGIVPGASLDAVLRVLKPDGRLIASLRPVDGEAGDLADRSATTDRWGILRDALASGFRIEARFSSELPSDPGGGPARPPSPVALDVHGPGGDWIVVASRDPLAFSAGSVPYRHPQFDAAWIDGATVADFGRHYRNPWLYRSMIQMGERLTDKELLDDLAAQVVGRSEIDTPDFGAALAVLTYSVIRDRRFASVPDLLAVAQAYIAQENSNPHVLRWRISLAYAGALTCLMTGDRVAAADWFATATSLDPVDFSPLLATKTVAAWFWLGVLRLVDRDPENARAAFIAGVEAARRALHASDVNVIGNPERPLSFGFPELAEIADMASQCASALNNLALYERSPPLFWSKIDTRRFGLATWLLHLERENAALRAATADVRPGSTR